MKCYLSEDEWYPVASPEPWDESNNYLVSNYEIIDVPEDLIDRYNKALKEFTAVQDALYNCGKEE